MFQHIQNHIILFLRAEKLTEAGPLGSQGRSPGRSLTFLHSPGLALGLAPEGMLHGYQGAWLSGDCYCVVLLGEA